MMKGRHSAKKQPEEEFDENGRPIPKKRPFLGHFKYGISEIDTNFELKKFLLEQSERKLNMKNNLESNVKNFMEELGKVNSAKMSKI